jgi:phosphoglycolate phosphatase-like HAD superfamily hydrolase
MIGDKLSDYKAAKNARINFFYKEEIDKYFWFIFNVLKIRRIII